MNTLYYILAVFILSNITFPIGDTSLTLIGVGYLLWLVKSIVEAGYLAAAGINMEISLVDAIPRVGRYIVALALGTTTLVLVGALGLIAGSNWLITVTLSLAFLLGLALKYIYLACLIYREAMSLEGCGSDVLWSSLGNVTLPMIAGTAIGFLVDLLLAGLAGSPLVLSIVNPLPGEVEPWRSSLGEVIGVIIAARLIALRIG